VVLYCAQDQPFAEAVLEEFRQQTGLRVAAKFDTEALKSVGLYTELVADAERPRCDVFWNNEILSMIRLQRQGLLEAYQSPEAEGLEPFPRSARTDDHTWHAFATRARVILVNTRLLPREQWPSSLLDLTDERYRGKVVMAMPHHGMSATQAVCLFEVLGPEKARDYYRGLKANGVQLAKGNKDVAVWVGKGVSPSGQPALIGVTDTDDALAEVRAGHDVEMIFPDRDGSSEHPRMGTLYVPNTLGILKGSPNPAAARRLVDFLLSAEIEKRLAQSESGQIPFRPDLRSLVPKEVATPPGVKVMEVDFFKAADMWDEAQKFLRDEFATSP
jgi:iron(III) transport system substrate-binding protein